MKIIRFLLLCFVFFSSYSHNLMKGSIPFFGRITFCDILSGLAICMAVLVVRKVKVPLIFKGFMVLFITFCAGMIVTARPFTTFIELVILLFLGLTFILFATFFQTKEDLKKIIIIFAWSSLIASLIGIYDLFALITGLPQIIGQLYLKTRLPSGTFKNGGQAGAYMLVTFSILFPLLQSKLRSIFSSSEQMLLLISLIVSTLYIFISAKVAAIIGVVAAIFFYAVHKRKVMMIFPIILFAAIGVGVFSYLSTFEGNRVMNRIVFKFRTRIVNNVQDNGGSSKASEWMEDNYGKAIDVFLQYPFTGSGIGGFHTVFHQNEVHSTPLKLLGETGLIGTFGYLFFMLIVFMFFLPQKGISKNNLYGDFLSHLFPFLAGCIISWGYTYHLRKREFWIFIFIIYLVSYLMKEYERKTNQPTIQKLVT